MANVYLKAALGVVFGFAQAQAAADCTFLRDPDDFTARQARAWRETFNLTVKPQWRASGAAHNVHPSTLPRRDFIDDIIFDKLIERNLMAAPIATDEEFLRRVSLDLTGRIPSPEEIRKFVADTDPDKRDKLIDKLLASEAFIDKWTMWLGDLLKNTSFPSNFDRQQDGRNAYYFWLRGALERDMSLKDLAKELVTATGNHYDVSTGTANYPIASKTPMGPIQDTYDTMLAMTASTFLGLGEMDCLLCHNGRGHLEQVNLWGSRVTRLEAWRMAAFFSRLNMPKRNVPNTDFYYNSFDVSDRTTGGYDLNTNYGNRPNREPVNGVRTLTPEYLGTGAIPSDGDWRGAFARFMVEDPMFARNMANRLWKEIFNVALVEPVDGLDPARLDPKNPPPAPWKLQATHPELLERLAAHLRDYDFNLRGFLRTLVQSTAYQLSSRYAGEWRYEYMDSFARHYPRRLMAEEIHDAIAKATELPGAYTVRGFPNPIAWAMQLPEPAEPRSNGAVATFLNYFLRGNRDSQPRSSSLSILQQMNLMNDAFVLNRIRITASPALRAVAALGDNDQIVEELSLRFLSRKPTPEERRVALVHLEKADTESARNAAIEDLAWVYINKPEFLFSY